MSSSAGKKKKLYRHPALAGLRDEQVASVYKIAGVRKINTGGALIKEGEAERALYLIMGGAARMLKQLNGYQKELSVLGRGDWVPPQATTSRDGRGTASVIALEPLTAIVIEEGSLNALPPEIQLAVYRNINRLSSGLVSDLLVQQVDLREMNERLTSKLGGFLGARSDEYAKSEMLIDFLKGIPRLPMYATKLSVMLLDENVSTRDAAELIRLDPSLVSVILKRVNSAYYGFQGKISDFQHAVLILGFINVYHLVMDIGVRSTMPKTSEFNELQFHSMMVSIVSHQLSELCRVENAAMSSTIGLLHDIGKSVILLLKRRHPKMALFIDMLDHSKVGSILLKEWKIPDLVCKSLEYQSFPELLPPGNIPEELRESVAVLYISHLCYEYLLGRKESELPTSFFPEYVGLLNRPERSISELVDKQVFPSLTQRWNALPENVRQFLKRSQGTIGARVDEDA